MYTVSQSQLEVTRINFNELYLNPSAKPEVMNFPTNVWTYETYFRRKVDIKAKGEKFNAIKVSAKIIYRQAKSRDKLILIRASTFFKTKHLTAKEVDHELFFYLNETCIEHCFAWLAHKRTGTVFETQLMPVLPIRAQENVEQTIIKLWK